AARSSRDTLLGPILDRVRRHLAAESRGSRLAAEMIMRRTGSRTTVAVPEARLRGRSGATLLAISRLQFVTGGGDAERLTGSFTTGGEGLPRIAGQLVQAAGDRTQVALRMAPYEAGDARLAIPELALVRGADGAVGLAGEIHASGALPGGRAEGLVLPISGNLSPSRELSLWQDWTEIAFDRLRFANLALDRRRLTLCPPRGTAIVHYGAQGLKVAAGASSLQLAGRLGETPIEIGSGAVGFAWPGTVSARELVVTLGPAETATSFAISNLTARTGGEIAGRF